MKKFSLIFISLLVLGNILSPIRVLIDSSGVKITEKTVSADECVVLSAEWVPSGEQDKNNFYEDNKTAASIVFKTKNCVGAKNIMLSVYEADGGIANNDVLSDSGLYHRKIDVPSDNFAIRLKLGEEECEAIGSLGLPGYDCDLYFYLIQGNIELYDSSSPTTGNLYYECDGVCLDNAELLKIIPMGSAGGEPVNADAIKDTYIDPTYKLLAPIGLGSNAITEVRSSGGTCPNNPNIPNGIGCYLNIVFLIAIGICGILAVIMIVISGIQYMGDESVFGKTEAKGKIFSAILGLLIALGSYALLKTIDPALTGENGVNVDQVDAELQSIENIPTLTFEAITGKKTLSPSEYDAIGRKVAKEVGIPFCAIRVILERESKGNPGAIGFDENVRNTAIPSRIAFVNSGKKYSGETFTPSQDLITQKGFINQNKSSVTNTPGLGLDWRFSKGLGLTQITLFPAGYFTSGYKTNPPDISKKDVYPTTASGFTPRDLLDPEKNLRAGATIWKNMWEKCGKDIYKTWSAYGSGSCNGSSSFIKKEATARTEYYNGCPAADKNV